MASEVSIANRALQLLGSASISSLTENSKEARACNLCYATLRDAELRAHTWSFAKKQVQLSADSSEPLFDYDNSFTLPSDCLRALKPKDRTNLDWEIQGRKLYTDDDAPLDFTYVRQVTDPNTMDVLFREALSARMAIEMCEDLTQSESKFQRALNAYTRAIREARRVNALERVPEEAPSDPWVEARR